MTDYDYECLRRKDPETWERVEPVIMTDKERSGGLLSDAEYSVVIRLANAWNEFVSLESVHPDETTEFRQTIHAAQRIIMARPVQRKFNAYKAQEDQVRDKERKR